MHRQTIRLKNHDYSKPRVYFITICTKNKSCLFGCIENGRMILNDAGKMVEKWYLELQNKFLDINCGEYMIMPNHFHSIIVNVGANLCVCPNTALKNKTVSGEKRLIMPNKGEHAGSPLHRVIQWFKTMTTNEYIRGIKQYDWKPFTGKLWQRAYYEHIIRTGAGIEKITEYIQNNPINIE